ncbi:endo-1,4-beta-xylanase [Candidatus Latescibacterota bacterium]
MKNSIIFILALILFASGSFAQMTEDQILDQADARIEKHRKGYAILQFVGPDGNVIESGVSVDFEQTGHAFLFGSNIFWLYGKNFGSNTPENEPEKLAAYIKYYTELLNFATLPFYWWSFEPEKGKPEYDRIDNAIEWCNAHNITVKGHPLAWNYIDPGWLSGTPEEAMELQMERIGDCVRRFKGKLTIFDVVNEATEYDRPGPRENAPLLTAAINNMGVENYLRQAFTTARKANSDATLLINDYKTGNDYRDKVIFELVDKNGLKMYDVIGIQSHQHGGAKPVTELWEICERFAKFGKPLHFTENTFVSGEQGWDLTNDNPDFKWESTPEGEKRQAQDVVRFYTTLFSHPAVEAITWWDFSDDRSWMNAPSGFLRADMTPKPAYIELKRLVKEKWWTRTTAPVLSDGISKMHGFYGQYDVTVNVEGKELAGNFSFDKKTTGLINVRLK